MYQRTYVLAVDYFLQVADNVHIEHIDRKIVFLAHCCGSKVHYLQTLIVYLIVSYFGKLRCRRVFLWVCRINAIYTRTFKHYVGFYLDATQARTRIGSKIRVARTCREDADVTIFEQ